MRRSAVQTDARPRGSESGELAPFDPSDRATWRWAQPRRARREWTLLVGDHEVAAFRSRSLLGGGALARFSDRTVRLEWSVFHGARAVPESGGEPLAIYRPHWLRGGRIESGADTLKFRLVGFLAHVFEIRTADDLPLIRFRSRSGFLRYEAEIELEDAARSRADLRTLLALGWFVVHLARPRQH